MIKNIIKISEYMDKKGKHNESEAFLKLADKILSIERLPREKVIEKANEINKGIRERVRTLFNIENVPEENIRNELKNLLIYPPSFNTNIEGDVAIGLSDQDDIIPASQYHPGLDLVTHHIYDENHKVIKAATILHEIGHKKTLNIQVLEKTIMGILRKIVNTGEMIDNAIPNNYIYRTIRLYFGDEIDAWEKAFEIDPILIGICYQYVDYCLSFYIEYIVMIIDKLEQIENNIINIEVIKEALSDCLKEKRQFIRKIKRYSNKVGVKSDIDSVENAIISYTQDKPTLKLTDDYEFI
jgi:hypothetical protein